MQLTLGIHQTDRKRSAHALAEFSKTSQSLIIWRETTPRRPGGDWILDANYDSDMFSIFDKTKVVIWKVREVLDPIAKVDEDMFSDDVHFKSHVNKLLVNELEKVTLPDSRLY
jgi:hypothetical protein